MNLGRHFVREEKGQVLYMTLVLMLVLVIFSFVLMNVMVMAAMKVKAQNVADAMALSAATLKARLFNDLVNANGAIQFISLQGGRVPDTPYASPVDMTAGLIAAWTANAYVTGRVAQYDMTYQSRLERIAAENGLDFQKSKAKLFPLAVNPLTDIQWTYAKKLFTYFQGAPPVILPAPPFPAIAMEPNLASAAVQSRVTWHTRDQIIGGKLLGVTFPDIVTRARAELFDAGTGGTAWSRNWRVRLAPADDGMDDDIRTH